MLVGFHVNFLLGVGVCGSYRVPDFGPLAVALTIVVNIGDWTNTVTK